MNRYPFPHRSQLAALALVGLLAMIILLIVQQSLSGLSIQLPTARDEASIESTIADAQALSAADRKFYNEWYLPRTGTTAEVVVPADIHTADRKFYNAAVFAPGEVSTEIEAALTIQPADRKFYNDWYAPGTGTTTEVAAPANIDPADRKFFIK